MLEGTSLPGCEPCLLTCRAVIYLNPLTHFASAASRGSKLQKLRSAVQRNAAF